MYKCPHCSLRELMTDRAVEVRILRMTLQLEEITRDINFNLSEEQVQVLAKAAKDFCIAKGLIFQRPNANEPASVMLTPPPLCRDLHDKLKRLQPHLNALIHKISRDRTFLRDALQSTLAADPFTARLFSIYEEAEGGAGPNQPISLGIFRSDYFVDGSNGPKGDIAQIEFNTVAVGLVSYATQIPKLHKYILGLMSRHDIRDKVIESPVLPTVADTLLEAWRLYGSESAVLMLIVKDSPEVYTPDQRHLEYAILERNPYVKVIRRNLGQIYDQGVLKEDKALFVDGHEVAVAYFRAGYHPDQYPTENEWSARRTLELSRAIKCPTVAHHLMGTKKMQQVLASPGILERFIKDSAIVEQMRQTFAGLYSLDPGPEGDKNFEMCLSRPEDFVLKPQREGGDNNLFGKDVCKILTEHPDRRSQYILMDRIRPKTFTGLMVMGKTNQTQLLNLVREMGFVSVFISRADEVLSNKNAGYAVRCKSEELPEVGVSLNYGALDSAYLV